LKSFGRATAVALSISFLLVFCGTDLLFAQRRGGTRGRSQGAAPGSAMEKLVPIEYDKGPFDTTLERLPRAYGGHNIQMVYDSIQNSAPKDGGSEAGGPDRGMTGPPSRFSPKWIYAFQVKPTEISYDKHEQMMQVHCDLWTVLAEGTADKGKSGFRIDYVPQVDNKYAYSTADGKKIEIEELKFREYTLAFGNLGEFPVEKNIFPDVGQLKDKFESSPDDGLKIGTIVARVPAAKGEADEFERNIRLLVVCNLAKPYVTSETIHLKATPEKPREYLAQHKYLHVRLLELWFYDAYNGKVLMKIRSGRGPAD